ncbi:discoidin domain-containing protein [Actinomadura sp. SCN-SB]|uniref:discoidin domain-containing protein n=1 Tax=Actinomadura sp. SCN-SB TaxID=3373092 RepID=UPI00375287AA
MNRRVRAAIAVVTVLLVSLTLTAGPLRPPAAHAAPTGYSVLTDQQKRELLLSVLEKFVPHAESFWRDSDIPEPNTGRYLATGSGVTQPRGAGDIAFVYATLLKARPRQRSFGGVAREVMLDHTIRSIRYTALTNKLSGAGYDQWGGGTWQASLETYLWGFAAQVLWDRLDEDTRALVRKVVEAEADILVTKPIATARDGDTGAEDNAWNAPTPALAAALSPDDPRAPTWRETSIKLALNASSTAADAESEQVVDGRPVKDRMASVNLKPDLTLENHGFFNPIYQQVTHLNVGDAAIIEARAGRRPPEAYSFRMREIWDRVLGPLAADDGDLVMPAGQDWTSKDYQHLGYLSILATRFGRPDASVLESRALTTVARRQSTHQNGSILGQPELGYESMLVKRLAGAWWNHALFGPSPTPSESEYQKERAKTAGVRHHPDAQLVQGRFARSIATMSWDDARPMGLVVPRAEGHLGDPVFTYYAPQSLIGTARGPGDHTCDCREDRFSTAGTIGDRGFSMTAFPDGVTLLLDRGTGSAFTYSMEHIPGVTGERPVRSAGGTGLGDLSGNWVNLAGRLGMIVLGGSGIRAQRTTGTNDTTLVTGSVGDGSGNRGAVVLPLADHETTARLAGAARQPSVPAGWSALLARSDDGTGRLAVARWSGEPTARLSLDDARGAPVTREQAEITGNTAAVTMGLGAPASTGEVLRFFVHSDGRLLARQDGEDRAVLTNPGASAVRAAVRYVRDGRTRTGARVIEPGETLTARMVDDRLILAGPEYEHLRAAHATIGDLRRKVAGWRASGRLGPAEAARLTATAAQVDRAIADALGAVTAERPDTGRAAVAVANALRQTGRLSAGEGDVAAAVAAARRSVETELIAAQGSLRVVVGLRASGPAFPGEPLGLTATLLNRGAAAAVEGRLSLRGPEGWTLPSNVPAFTALPPGKAATVQLTATVSPSARPGTAADIGASLTYRAAGRPITTTGSVTAPVLPLITLVPDAPSLPLAAGGWNQAGVTVRSNADRPLDVRLTATAPDGITISPSTADLRVPAHGSANAAFELSNGSRVSGTGRLTVRTAGGVAAETAIDLSFSDNLARNPSGSRWPAAFAVDHQSAYPPGLAFDGDPASFWVSNGTAAGDGPSPTRPITLGVDFGHPLSLGSVTMRPRTGYGPKAYQIQVSDDGRTWRTVATVPDAANGPVTTAFPAVTARFLQLSITDSWDRIRPPRNVQTAELEVRRP